MTYQSPDRPEPTEQQPIRARVPEHVSKGAFSTGVIVMTANTELILDFVQNLGRPHQIVSRVVMPHHVLPQLVDALHRNIELYRGRWGELPTTGPAPSRLQQAPVTGPHAIDTHSIDTNAALGSPTTESHSGEAGVAHPSQGPQGTAGSAGIGAVSSGAASAPSETPDGEAAGGAPGGQEAQRPAEPGQGVRQASAQEIYDDLKIRDELLSGAYANAVMIGHGPHEFSFDFITNFYPNSAVSARVFLAAGQVPRLYESLKGTWEQLRARMKNPGQQDPGQSGGSPPSDPGPSA